jgi:hypothetical protein
MVDLSIYQLRNIRATIQAEATTLEHFNTMDGRRMVTRSAVREYLTIKFEGVNSDEAMKLMECAVQLEQARSAGSELGFEPDAWDASAVDKIKPKAKVAKPEVKPGNRFSGLDLGDTKRPGIDE